jgi:N-acetylneuraminic acid mutarotase
MISFSKLVFFHPSFSVVLVVFTVIGSVILPPSLFAVYGTTSQPSWSSGEPLPTPRSEVAVAVLKDKIYVIGGQDKHVKKTDIVEVYDLTSKRWSTGVPLPEPLDHVGLAVNNGKLYLVGGTSEKGISNKLQIYDPALGKWKEGKPMSTARTALTVAFIEDKLYAVGGVDNLHNVVAINEAYDPHNDTWTEKTAMPTARHHLTGAVVDGKLYAIGGRLLGDGQPSVEKRALSNKDDNEMYDPIKSTWTKLRPMPIKNSGMTAASVGNNIYVFGGESTNGSYAFNEKYDTKTDVWTSEIPLPAPRLGLKAVAVNNTIYVIGGKPTLGSRTSDEVDLFHVPNH